MQQTHDKILTQKSQKLPNTSSLITYHHVPPKGYKATIPNITQDEEDNHPETQQPVQYNPIPKLRQNRPAAISQEALYHIVGVGYTNTPEITIPDKLKSSRLTIEPAIDIEELCNGVVHPVTQETITKYQKLANDPLLQEV